jgi:hypothetical protein
MRWLAIFFLLALLAWRPFASDEKKAHYILEGSGAELCTKVIPKPGASDDVPLKGLIRITCDLDGALLSLENYYPDNMAASLADPSDRLIGRLRSPRHRPGR